MTAITNLMALIFATLNVEASVETMMFDLGASLSEHGPSVRTALLSDAAPNQKMLLGLLHLMRDSGMPGIIVITNARSELVIEERDGGPLTIHDAWNLPLVAHMLDHPAHHINQLRRAPEKALITVIDEGHLRFLREMGIRARGSLFCPHGGPRPLASQRDTADRPIDLLFIGNIEKPRPLAEWLAETSGGGDVLYAALAEAYDAVVDADLEVYEAIFAACARRGIAVQPLQVATLVAALDTYVSQSRRFRVLKAIRHRKVTIFGQLSMETAIELGHHDVRGSISYARGLDLMAKTKILLNSRVTFARGAHERVFYGLSRGAIVATEDSSFLAPELDQGLGLARLPKDESSIDSSLSTLLDDHATLDAMRDRGLPHYARHHTWNERAGRILSALAADKLI